MSKESPYAPKNVVNNIMQTLCNLKESEAETPTGIAKKTNYDKKTINRYLDLLESQGIVECKKISIGRRTIKACSLKEQQRCSHETD